MPDPISAPQVVVSTEANSGAKATKRPRKRRVSEVLPELRKSIFPLWRRGVTAERIAEDLDVAPLQILEHVVRECTGAKHPNPASGRKAPASESLRAAQQPLQIVARRQSA